MQGRIGLTRTSVATAACITALAALPLPVAANSITLEIRPSDDLRGMISCSVQLDRGQFVVVEVVGPGFVLLRPVRFAASGAETAVMLTALGALLSNDPPSVPDPITARMPQPPFVSVTWMAEMTDGLQSGLYLQQGYDLPDVLDAVVNRLLTGGPCAAALNS